MRWFLVAFLPNGVLNVTHGGMELKTPELTNDDDGKLKGVLSIIKICSALDS